MEATFNRGHTSKSIGIFGGIIKGRIEVFQAFGDVDSGIG
jgi:hypothetical protein